MLGSALAVSCNISGQSDYYRSLSFPIQDNLQKRCRRFANFSEEDKEARKCKFEELRWIATSASTSQSTRKEILEFFEKTITDKSRYPDEIQNAIKSLSTIAALEESLTPRILGFLRKIHRDEQYSKWHNAVMEEIEDIARMEPQRFGDGMIRKIADDDVYVGGNGEWAKSIICDKKRSTSLKLHLFELVCSKGCMPEYMADILIHEHAGAKVKQKALDELVKANDFETLRRVAVNKATPEDTRVKIGNILMAKLESNENYDFTNDDAHIYMEIEDRKEKIRKAIYYIAVSDLPGITDDYKFKLLTSLPYEYVDRGEIWGDEPAHPKTAAALLVEMASSDKTSPKLVSRIIESLPNGDLVTIAQNNPSQSDHILDIFEKELRPVFEGKDENVSISLDLAALAGTDGMNNRLRTRIVDDLERVIESDQIRRGFDINDRSAKNSELMSISTMAALIALSDIAENQKTDLELRLRILTILERTAKNKNFHYRDRFVAAVKLGHFADEETSDVDPAIKARAKKWVEKNRIFLNKANEWADENEIFWKIVLVNMYSRGS